MAWGRLWGWARFLSFGDLKGLPFQKSKNHQKSWFVNRNFTPNRPHTKRKGGSERQPHCSRQPCARRVGGLRGEEGGPEAQKRRREAQKGGREDQRTQGREGRFPEGGFPGKVSSGSAHRESSHLGSRARQQASRATSASRQRLQPWQRVLQREQRRQTGRGHFQRT